MCCLTQFTTVFACAKWQDSWTARGVGRVGCLRNSKLTERNLGDGDAGTEASITAGLGFVALSFEASEHTILSAA